MEVRFQEESSLTAGRSLLTAIGSSIDPRRMEACGSSLWTESEPVGLPPVPCFHNALGIPRPLRGLGMTGLMERVSGDSSLLVIPSEGRRPERGIPVTMHFTGSSGGLTHPTCYNLPSAGRTPGR